MPLTPEAATLEHLPRLVVAGTHSGVGKTTVSSAIIAGWCARGLRVQPWKAGPDYIDPTHLSHAAGYPARNLDPYILPPDVLEALFCRAARCADANLIEGMMGLFDGEDATSDAASTADLARRLDAPVVLVLDVSGTARSAAATALGFRAFAPDLRIAGVILNRIGSRGHAKLCEAALEQIGVRSFGFLVGDEALKISARHLGLVLSGEARLDLKTAQHASQTLDLDGLLEVARGASAIAEPATWLPRERRPVCARIAVARDEAFSFYYEDALDLLRDCGAELVPFSPLRDQGVPDAGGLLIGGGYPELHAARLAENRPMLESVRAFCASGKPVLAECGGLMYLGESLRDLEGHEHTMCGAIPARTRMLEHPILGYREMVALLDSPIARAGTAIRGHEFHCSRLETPLELSTAYPAYRRTDGTQPEGFVFGNVLASYIHQHLASDAGLANRFVELATGGPS